jgi:signal transduction histidine kinase
MSLQTFFEPANSIYTLVLALSIFNLVAFLWLAMTVWLNGDRRAGITRLGIVGLGLSALFFFLHSILISTSLSDPLWRGVLDMLWHLIWIPAIGVPYIWFAIGLHYATLINQRWVRRRPILLGISGALGSVVLLLLVLNSATFTFNGTLELLAYGNPLDGSRMSMASPLVLPALFLCYVTFCAIGPWFTPARVSRTLHAFWHALFSRKHFLKSGRRRALHTILVDAFWDDQEEVEQLEEPLLSWQLARPGLLLAALLMVALTTSLGVIIIWSIVNWLELEQHPSLPAHIVLSAIPFNLLLIDFIATGAVALIILLLGYSVVRHGILIERPLARQGFFEQWRGIVIVATTAALFIATLVTLTHGHLAGMLVITSFATGVYALFTWSSYTTHDHYIALLGPFLRSASLRHWLNTDLVKTESDLENLFFHLCHDVLAVRCARMIVLAGTVRRNFSYRWPDAAWSGETQRGLELKSRGKQARRIQITFYGQPLVCWVLPIYDERGLVAALYLGPRQDGSTFTDEDMNLAHACGQRILDTLGDHEAMQAVTALLRRRIVDVKLLGAQQRRVLHDEILPQMHLALLHLETARSLNASPRLLEPGEQVDEPVGSEAELNEAIGLITDAHRQLAAMMRTTASGAPHRLERDGIMSALHTMINQDFQNAFDEVEWRVSEQTASYIDEVLPPAIAELIFAAVQEALRNAARHARGQDLHRHLRLVLQATCEPDLEMIVSDNGVGISSTASATTGTGGGLITHSALLAIAGGSLTTQSTPGEGVTVRIHLPASSLL